MGAARRFLRCVPSPLRTLREIRWVRSGRTGDFSFSFSRVRGRGAAWGNAGRHGWIALILFFLLLMTVPSALSAPSAVFSFPTKSIKIKVRPNIRPQKLLPTHRKTSEASGCEKFACRDTALLPPSRRTSCPSATSRHNMCLSPNSVCRYSRVPINTALHSLTLQNLFSDEAESPP